MAGSVGNQDFLVALADGSGLVLKAGDTAELAGETWACRRARAVGVLAPQIVAFESRPVLPRSFLVMRRLDGGPSRDPDALREAGRQLRVAHSVELAGYGSLEVSGDGASGRRVSWSEVLAEKVSGVPQLMSASVLTEPLASRAVRFATDPELVGFERPVVLLHGDLKEDHILASGSRLTGIIDWGDATAGDPLLDLARMSMAGPEVFGPFAKGYGFVRTDELDVRLAGYRITDADQVCCSSKVRSRSA